MSCSWLGTRWTSSQIVGGRIMFTVATRHHQTVVCMYWVFVSAVLFYRTVFELTKSNPVRASVLLLFFFFAWGVQPVIKPSPPFLFDFYLTLFLLFNCLFALSFSVQLTSSKFCSTSLFCLFCSTLCIFFPLMHTNRKLMPLDSLCF